MPMESNELQGPASACTGKAPKEATGIKGFDEVLMGGVPKGAMTLLVGGPGTGKTMFGLEFLVRGAVNGGPGILLTFEERKDALRRYASSFGWDVKALEEQGRLSLISARIKPDAVFSGDFDLQGLLGILENKIAEMKAENIVIDAPDVLLRLLGDEARERGEFHLLHEWILDSGLTAMVTVKANAGARTFRHHEFLEYMADCVVHLDQRVSEQVVTRRLRVVKYRGSSYGRNEYPFGITGRGLWIIPVTQADLQHRAFGESITSGVKDLDALISGGYRRNSCTLITGASGTGKTTFACSYCRAITSLHEKVLYLDFEESWDALASCMLSPGLDMNAALDTGHLKFISSMPESQGIEEHLIQAFKAIEDFQPRHLILDAISACRRMGSKHSAFDYLLRLVTHCKKQGITVLLTNLSSPSPREGEITGLDLSSIIDTVILLRNVETDRGYERKLVILKSRGRSHSNMIHDFRITSHGVKVIEREASDDGS